MGENMSNSKPDKKSLHDQFFDFLHRYIPPIRHLAAKLDRQGKPPLEQSFWILGFLGMVPALRAGLLFPTNWYAELGAELMLAGIDNIFGWFSIVFIVSLILVVILQRKAWRFIAILPFVFITLADSSVSDVVPGLNYVYLLTTFIFFLYFVVAGSTRKAYFLVFVVGLAVAQVFDGFLNWDRIIEFTAFSIVASLLYETWRQNRKMLRDFGRESILKIIWKTFSLWSPTILLIAAGLTISQTMLSGTEDLIYESTFIQRHCGIAGSQGIQIPCPESGNKIERNLISALVVEVVEPNTPKLCSYQYPRIENVRGYGPQPEYFNCPADYPNEDGWIAERLPFEASLDRSIDRQFAVTNYIIQNRLRSMEGAVFDISRTAGTKAQQLFDVVPKTLGIKINSCKWYQLKCQIVAAVKRSIVKSYVRVRSQAEQAFINQMQARADAIAKGVNDTNTRVSETVKTEIQAWSDATRRAILSFFTVYNIAKIVMTFWLIVIAIKSFLYVFARVVFDRSTRVEVDLADDDTLIREGKVEHVQEVNIPGDYPHDIYYKSNYQPLGPAPRFSIPQLFASMLSRVRFGSWNLSHVPMPCDDNEGLTFNSVQADHLVDWQMQEGEEVVFSYGNFVAMNANVKLKTIVSLRVASLLFGRFIFHAARCEGGPGRLILRTRGRPATAKQVRQSIPVSRLIAWNSFARFSVDSHLTRTDVFLNGFNLRRSGSGKDSQGILVVEADARDGGVLVGTLRFAKHFLLPI
jgi:hypothetical protein